MVLEKKGNPGFASDLVLSGTAGAPGTLQWALGIRLTERFEGVNLKGTTTGTRERARNLGQWPRKSDLLRPKFKVQEQ